MAELSFEQHTALLHELAHLSPGDGRSVGESLAPVLGRVSEVLDVPRVGVWLYPEDDATSLECVAMHHGGTSQTPLRLSRSEYPGYFAALGAARSLAVEDALGDPRTAELRPGYLEPVGVRSLLDAAVVLGGQPVGVLCCEETRRARRWLDGERALVASVGDLVGRFVLACREAELHDTLQRSEELYRRVVEDLEEVIIRVAPGGAVVFVNRAGRRLVFGDELPRPVPPLLEHVPPADRARVMEGIARITPDSPVIRHEHRVLAHGGRQPVFSFTVRGIFHDGNLEAYQAIGVDVSVQRERDARLLQAQRLEALAVLSGGIAHDFNNLLFPMMAFTESVLGRLPPDGQDADDLRQVLRAADRARDLVRQILVFSRKDERSGGPSDAGATVRDVVSFLRASIPSSVQMELTVDADAGLVAPSQSDLYQLVSNLCTNAYQAMPGGGRLVVSLTRVAVPPATEPSHVQLLVRDTGVGMEPEVRDRIFEPFFTTKGATQGTGLGLAVVHGIVRAAGGTIDVQSAPGQGTSFVVLLPLLGKASQPVAAPVAKLDGPPGPVLVVDDEPAVAAAITRMLEDAGVQVVTRQSAGEALVELNRRGTEIRAVITDLTMPQMSGVELAFRIRRTRPDVPIVVMSGFGEVLSDAQRQSLRGAVFLSKPASARQLSDALARAIEASGGGGAPETES